MYAARRSSVETDVRGRQVGLQLAERLEPALPRALPSRVLVPVEVLVALNEELGVDPLDEQRGERRRNLREGVVKAEARPDHCDVARRVFVPTTVFVTVALRVALFAAIAAAAAASNFS